jgi:ferric-dicitrate binding protein FerR (iron transport regulator)
MIEFDKIESAALHYLQGNISDEEMRELNSWLTEKDEHKQWLFRLKEIYDLRKGGLFPDKKEIEKSWQRFAGKMEKQMTANKKQQRAKRSAVISFCKYAAVALVCVCLTLGIQRLLRNDLPGISSNISNDIPIIYNELDVAAGPRMSRLTLPDGTKVTLNASTKFKFPDRFDPKIREVFLDGEAFFDVERNEAPFVVHTARQKISVLGTIFNVMDYSADDYAITTLVKGSVKVQSVNESGTEYLLKPNQQAYFDKSSSDVLLSDVSIDPNRTWVNKIYHFRDEPLIKITKRLEKIYGVTIDITNDLLKEEKYTGTFYLDLTIDEVLKIINFDKHFSYKINNENIVIKN